MMIDAATKAKISRVRVGSAAAFAIGGVAAFFIWFAETTWSAFPPGATLPNFFERNYVFITGLVVGVFMGIYLCFRAKELSENK
jgi:hypothetical protein